MKRVLALDIGEKRIGVAVSDPLGYTAQGVETIFTRGDERDVRRVVELAAQYDTDRVVAGLPRALDGSVGYQARRAMAFADQVAAAGLNVRYQDERMTSVSAQRVLLEGNVRREKRKQVVDMLAATYILQSFLDAGGWEEDKQPDHPEKKEVFRLMDGKMESDTIVTLFDEDNKEVHFEHIMTIEHNGEQYVLLSPAEEMEDIGEDELVILRIDQTDEGEDVYVGIEDEKLLADVYEKYLQIAEADEDDEE